MKALLSIIMFVTTVTVVSGQDLILGVENSVIWGKESTSDVSLDLSYKAKVKPASMKIGYDNPNGTKFRIYFKDLNVAIDLRNIISMSSGMNEWGECNQGYYVQVATHDFDGDKNPEIIIAVGNGLFDMSVNVIKYHPPINSDDAIRNENWSIVANFEGQDKIYVENGVITVPIGSQGLFDEYTWLNGKFVKSN